MLHRTDLAIEIGDEKLDDIEHIQEKTDNIIKTTTTIKSKSLSSIINKPIGKYITIEMPEFPHESEVQDSRMQVLKDSIMSMIPLGTKNFLAVGLGNENITSDALGPCTTKHILATRHLSKLKYKHIGNFNNVSVISTGVLGQTGIETREYIKSICEITKPDLVIIVDALVSRNINHLGKTVQLTDTGISPGSGVGNSRCEINSKYLDTNVISIGVPTVVDGNTFAYDLSGKECSDSEQIMVTPKNIDEIINNASSLLGLSINCAFNPKTDSSIFLSLI